MLSETRLHNLSQLFRNGSSQTFLSKLPAIIASAKFERRISFILLESIGKLRTGQFGGEKVRLCRQAAVAMDAGGKFSFQSAHRNWLAVGAAGLLHLASSASILWIRKLKSALIAEPQFSVTPRSARVFVFFASRSQRVRGPSGFELSNILLGIRC